MRLSSLAARATFAVAALAVAAAAAPVPRIEPAAAPSTVPPSPTTVDTTSTSTTTTSTSTTTTTTTVPVATTPDGYRHPEWIALAVEVGWPNDPRILATLDLVIERESHGRPDAQNPRDPGSLGSLGLAQINSGAWCDPTKYYPTGFMQTQGIGLSTCLDLLDPVVNLRAALVIWKRQGDFGAWSTV